MASPAELGPNIARLRDAERVWGSDLGLVVNRFSEQFDISGEAFEQYIHLRLVEADEETFYPYPILRPTPDGIDMIVNLDGYTAGWLDIFDTIPGIDKQQVRDIYLGMGVAWAEMAFTSYTAMAERGIKGRGPAINRTKRLIKQLQDQSGLLTHAVKLQDEGIADAMLMTADLDNEQTFLINYLRYGLGASYLAMGMGELQIDTLTASFHESMGEYVATTGDRLLKFMGAFALTSVSSPEEYVHDGVTRAFPELLFAGTIPMDMVEIISGPKKRGLL